MSKSNKSKSIRKARKSRSNGQTMQYLQTVAQNVASMGKPDTGSANYFEVMASRVKAEIKSTVPANYRLAVRTAIKGYVNQIVAATKGI